MSRTRRTAVAVVILAVAVVGGVWLERSIRVGKDRSRSMMAVRGIIENIGWYSDFRRSLPPPTFTDPDGKPLFSWRFRTTAIFLNDHAQAGFYGQAAALDKPWDAPENRRYHSGPFWEFPGGPADHIDPTRPGSRARFVAVAGPGAAFDESKHWKFDELPGDVLLVVEATGCPVHWMEPGGDVDVRTVPRTIGAAGGIGPAAVGSRGFYVGFADLSVWLLRTDVPFETLAKFFTVIPAGPRDRDADLRPYAVQVWP